MKVTIRKKTQNAFTYNALEIDELVANLRGGAYSENVWKIRNEYPMLSCRRDGDINIRLIQENMPNMCFTSLVKKINGEAEVREYNALVMLEVNNLQSEDEAKRIKGLAMEIPYTMLCFMGDTGYDVKIVCKARFAGDFAKDDNEKVLRLHTNAYKLLHYHYSTQLMLTVDNIKPELMTWWPVSVDEELYYNPGCEPISVSDREVAIPKLKETKGKKDSVLPGTGKLETLYRIFEWCLDDAYDKARAVTEKEEEFVHNLLSCLADNCCDSGLPIDFAKRGIAIKNVFQELNGDYIDEVLRNAYERKCKIIPFGHIKKSALLIMKTEAFLYQHYELRRNVITGVVQYRKLDGYDYTFKDLTQQVMNSMTKRALKAGIDSWDKDMNRLVNSDEVPEYDPIYDYLLSLPKWNGKDHVGELIARLPIDKEKTADDFPWQEMMRVWLRSMVAHWLGRDVSHGNALVPLIIGGQGCGKTSFCNILLPPELRDYFNDKVDFKNDTNLALGLSRFALINIDEFDSVKKSQQPVLKYLLSKSDIKMRLPYGKSIVMRRRYASFIATTNDRHPLIDNTGSRRFLCLPIENGALIDFLSSVNYEQLYAQLYHEVMSRERYWLTDEETQMLMRHNAKFQKVVTIDAMIASILRLPTTEESGEYVTGSEIIELILGQYPEFMPTKSTSLEIGRVMRTMGFKKKHVTKGQVYLVKCK